jgi:hypothetical protein
MLLLPRDRSRRLQRIGAAILTASVLGCYNFHKTGPEDPASVSPPQLVSVTVEYRQPNGCVNTATPCDEPVVFFGSWMQGAGFRLTRDTGSFVWRGVAQAVPVNYPPTDSPYKVWVFDPFMRESPAQGTQADRLKVGGETLVRLDGGGGREQHALVYIDANGQGHNPY